ncbi:MAG: HPF/RaiA family ribosome-associated protein [Flavobacterium sp.]|uniref:HPF/RaiA family ribosome-associated protein n=1 Tax=Flavobacterium sp. TaxID=239 RepID=UPI0025BD9026|nr:HPF/RaiA family ribosome-associated protein [Flavobacterium sp.]MCA1966837.1 HPF/RaiA family ribosome-associated protein [Flavobacterium sp.]
MLVQIHTDKNIEGGSRFSEFFTNEIKNELARFDEIVTRIEVHVSDENGNKTSPNDKKCVIEARVEKKQPIAVTATADSAEKAFFEALEKIQRVLDTTLDKIKEH